MSDQPLAGHAVAVTAERKGAEICDLFRRRGAVVHHAPAVHTVALPEDGELAAATRAVLRDPVDVVIAVTGVGFTGWLRAADELGVGARLRARLGQARLIARGAKARGAIRGAGLTEEWSAASEETREILDHLRARGVVGKRIVVQAHGQPMTDFQNELRAAGADVVVVPVYRWTDPVELPALDRLIERICAGEVDALPLTSAPAATNLLDRAERIGAGERLRTALRSRVLVACVGPVTAGPIGAAGLPWVQPERARTAALVKLVADRLPGFLAARRG